MCDKCATDVRHRCVIRINLLTKISHFLSLHVLYVYIFQMSKNKLDVLLWYRIETKRNLKMCDIVVCIITAMKSNNWCILFWIVSAFSTLFCSNPAICEISVCHRERVRNSFLCKKKFSKIWQMRDKRFILNNWLSQGDCMNMCIMFAQTTIR